MSVCCTFPDQGVVYLMHGAGIWQLDQETLRVTGSYPEPAPDLPDELLQPQLAALLPVP